MAGWVHLQIASAFSRQYGTAQPEALIAHLADAGHDMAALTDRDGLSGAVRWVQGCAAAQIAPMLGVDLAYDLPSASRRRTPAHGGQWRTMTAPRVLLYASGSRGWAALCRVVSAAHANRHDGIPVLDPTVLAAYADDLRVILGAQSDVGRFIAGRHDAAATQALRPWREIFGARLAIGLTCHGGPNRHPTSVVSAARMWWWAHERGLPVVLTNAVRMLRESDAEVADVLDAARLLIPLSSSQHVRASPQAYAKDGTEMAVVADAIARAAGRRDASELLRETRAFAAACVIDPAEHLGLGRVYVPEQAVVLGAHVQTSADAVIRQRCERALEHRYSQRTMRERAQKRLDDELRTIHTLGFAGYFLTVAEVVDLIKARGIRVAARGSGAGSLVNHLLGISGIDPLRHGLLMERFLSPLRASLPDIDIDVESAERTNIYGWIFERFGHERVACVSMMETYRVRHAIRDVGMAFGMPTGEIDVFAKSFPHLRARQIRSALEELPELRNSGFGKLAAAGHLDRFLRIVEALDRLPRHIALHPCGVLLSDQSLLDRTAIEPSASGFAMSQFDKDDVETMGLLKLDVLGVRMQSALAHAVAEIDRMHDVRIGLDELPLDDRATFELIASTNTLGCFQIESPGQRELVGKFAPETFNDIIIDISLFRPGPMKSDMITPFLQARQGWRPAEYLHPDLEPILGETYGVVVFHEQVLRLVAQLTGCSLAEADEVRRRMGDRDAQAAIEVWFKDAAKVCGYDEVVRERAWEVLHAFASFGFCKAHAAAFALPTYQSAWLKTHYPAAFFAGILTHDPGMYPKRLLLDDARHQGVTILGLDINRSGDVFAVEPTDGGYGIRIPFTQMHGISDVEVAALIAGQPYQSFEDVWQRANVSRPTAENLVLAGAFDAMYRFGNRQRLTRRDLLVHIADVDRYRPRHGQAQLALDIAPDLGAVHSGLAELTPAERVRAELAVLGLDVSHHLMDFYQPMLSSLQITRSSDVLNCRSNQMILVAGVKVAVQTPPIRSGKRVIFCSLDDGRGAVDLAFFEDVQRTYASTVFGSWLLLARGHVRRTGPRGVSIRATGCWELSQIREHWLSGGPEAVWALIDADQPEAETMTPRHTYVHASGVRQSPYADVRAAQNGDVPRTPPSKLWHSSPGSSGW
jgi:error-prone DNA polymerase